MTFVRFIVPGTISLGALFTFAISSVQAKSRENHERKEIHRVAIIGSGIGGSSAAHFVRQMLGPGAQIQVFERTHRVGGRLATIDIAGNTYESGGSIIHPSNKYMTTFAQDLGLGRKTSDDGIFSLYDGNSVVLETSTWSWMTALKLFWRYGFSIVKMNSIVKDILKKFLIIYELQDNGNAYESVPELLRAMGGDEFYGLTQMSIRKYLLDKGLSQLLIDELATAVMRINYGQSSDVNAFTGCVSLAGAEPGLWAVEGGNWKVCEGLLKKSGAIINNNSHIIEIIKRTDNSDGNKPLYYLRSVESLVSTPFDVVIMAMPLEITDNFIGCDGCENWPCQKNLGRFQQTVATFQTAKLNEKTFKFTSQQPSIVGTMEKPEICFSSVGQQTSVWKKKVDDEEGQILKVFTREPLTKECKEKIFSQSGDSKEVIWLAYPHYTPPEKFLPFVLDDGIFYVNAIEWAASAMEMSALSGRNAALLAARYLNKGKPSASKKEREHREL